MLQQRTLSCPKHRIPKQVPNFLADLKPDNWGLYKGKPVAHDYGNNAVYTLAQRAYKMQRGKWHDGKGGNL